MIGGIIMWIIDARASRYEPNISARRRDVSRPGHLDRPLPVTLRHLPRNLALHVHHRRRPDRRHDRPAALEFSFLLSIPTMLAATGWDLLKAIHPSQSALAAGAVRRRRSHMNTHAGSCSPSASWFRSSWPSAWSSGSWLGSPPRLHRLRRLPHHPGNCASDFWQQAPRQLTSHSGVF